MEQPRIESMAGACLHYCICSKHVGVVVFAYNETWRAMRSLRDAIKGIDGIIDKISCNSAIGYDVVLPPCASPLQQHSGFGRDCKRA